MCTFPLARELFQIADETLGFSLSQICFEGPEDKLTLTEIVQPAILTVSTICYRLAEETSGKKLNVVSAAGHSLGEYSALTAAGAIDFETAVLLVHKRGKYMQEAVPVGQGKMNYELLFKLLKAHKPYADILLEGQPLNTAESHINFLKTIYARV